MSNEAKEKAIEYFRSLTLPNSDVFEVLEATRKRAEEAISIAAKPDWISVDEPPKKSGWYNIYLNNVTCGFYSTFKKEWESATSGFIFPTLWLPLPSKPE